MSGRLNPLKKHGDKPILHKTDDAKTTAYQVKSKPRVRDTPNYDAQIEIARKRCEKYGQDIKVRGHLLSHVNAWLSYYDGGTSGLDGHHDLYWMAQNDPGFMARLCYENLQTGSTSRQGLSGFKLLISVS